MIGLLWLTMLYCALFIPATVPVLLISGWLVWSRQSPARADVPRSVWSPSIMTGLMFLWGSAFGQPSTGVWHGFRWPAAIAGGLFVAACVLAWRVWQRASRDRRVTGLLVGQLWFGAVATWVVAGAVSPGSGLGAL